MTRLKGWQPKTRRQELGVASLVVLADVLLLIMVARQPLTAMGVLAVTTGALLIWPEILAALRGIDELRRVLNRLNTIKQWLKWALITALTIVAVGLVALVVRSLLGEPTPRTAALALALLLSATLLGGAFYYVLWFAGESLGLLLDPDSSPEPGTATRGGVVRYQQLAGLGSHHRPRVALGSLLFMIGSLLEYLGAILAA